MSWAPDWRDRLSYSQVVVCPGCCQAVTVRTSSPVVVEWDALPDRAFIGWAMHATDELLEDFWYEAEGYDVGGWEDPGRGENVFGRPAFGVHECQRGEVSGDGEIRQASPPANSGGVELDNP
jgi:hypothetical protein